MQTSLQVRSRSRFFKILITSEFFSIIFGILFTFITTSTEVKAKDDKYYPLCEMTEAAWIWLLAFRGPVFSILLPLLFAFCYEPSPETDGFVRLRKKFSDNYIITFISSVLTLAAMAGMYLASSRIISNVYNPDPARFPPGIIDCSAAKLSQFASDVVINVAGPALLLGLREAGFGFFNCVKERKDQRAAEQLKSFTEGSVVQFSRYTGYNTL